MSDSEVDDAKSQPIAPHNNFVFLLGAGFAAPYGCPVMNAFMEQARANFFSMQADEPTNKLITCYRTLFQFQAECLNSSWAFNRNWENIEELYTQADLLRLAGHDDAAHTCTQIAWAIWDVYRRFPTRNHSELGALSNKLFAEGLQPVFITTNYDTVVEHQLSHANRPHYHPGLQEVGPQLSLGYVEYDTIHRTNQIPVIKLHGSVNWFQMDNKQQTWMGLPRHVRDDAILNCRRTSLSLAPFQEEVGKLFVKQTQHVQGSPSPDPIPGNEMAPAIIPPMLGKAHVSGVIKAQWTAAIDALHLARQVWVIGYSFPPTDAFMLRLLTAGIQENPYLQKVVIIDWELYPEWATRLTGMFSPPMLAHRVEFYSASSENALARLLSAEQHQWRDGLTEISNAHITKRINQLRLKDPSLPKP